MKRHRWLLVISVLLNVLLVGLAVSREMEHRTRHFLLATDASNWARYAGAIQGQADYGLGVRRILHLIPSSNDQTQGGFTGEREGQAEVWAWVYDPAIPDVSQASQLSFTDSYNQRMRAYIANPAAYTPPGLPATRPAK